MIWHTLHPPWLYFTVRILDSPLIYHGSTSLYRYFNLHITLPWLCFTILDSILFSWPSSLYLTLLHPILPLFHSNWLYIALLWLYLTLLHPRAFYHSSTSLHWTLHYSTFALLYSTWLQVTLTRLFFTFLNSTAFYKSSTSIYFTLHYSTVALIHSTGFYITLP